MADVGLMDVPSRDQRCFKWTIGLLQIGIACGGRGRVPQVARTRVNDRHIVTPPLHRQSLQPLPTGVTKLIARVVGEIAHGRPQSLTLWKAGSELCSFPRCPDELIHIANDARPAEIGHEPDDIQRARSASGEIASVDDQIDAERFEIGDDGFECRPVSVHVGDYSNAHPATC